MFYDVEVPRRAYEDITELSNYVFQFSMNKNIAIKVYNDLYKAISSLEFMPERYQEYLGEYRRIIVKGSYKIIYKINIEEKKVVIIRVVRTEMSNINFE